MGDVSLSGAAFADRYRPALIMFNVGLFFMALRFGVVVVNGGSPITPEIYGPAVYAFPALGWAAIQAVSAAVAIAGLVLNWRPLVALGALPNVVLQGVFCGLSSMAAQGTLLQTGTMFITLPICIATFHAGAMGMLYGRG